MQPAYYRGGAARPRWRFLGGKWLWWLLFTAVAGAIVTGVFVRAGAYGATTTSGASAYGAGTAPSGGGKLPDGWTMTSFGPLGPADRELLVRVRQAGLWEGPAGQLAQTRASDARVKEVGAQLTTDHHGLDAQVRLAAAQLGVPLPDKPTAEQQGWVTELTGKTGDDFDRTFANRLRAAHGKVFTIVGQVRTGTRNSLIRTFAQTAVNVVMKHMTLLESIGNVDYGALPTPVLPASTPTAAQSTSGIPANMSAIWFVAGLALLGGAAAAVRVVRGARAARHRAPAF